MGVKKVLGGSAGAVFLLIVSQVLASAAGMGLDGLNIPAGICNMAAGALYLTIALFLTRQSDGNDHAGKMPHWHYHRFF